MTQFDVCVYCLPQEKSTCKYQRQAVDFYSNRSVLPIGQLAAELQTSIIAILKINAAGHRIAL